MKAYRLVIIGGGLSGLAAGIRFARFGQKVLILERHTIPGGLNSYYYRNGFLLETGLHAMTNYAPADHRHAPLNQLFRQLKLPRRQFATHEQLVSEVIFAHGKSLCFANDFSLLKDEVKRSFPHAFNRFMNLVGMIDAYDPFLPRPWTSARQLIAPVLEDDLLTDMLLWPLMIYGNSNEHDMDAGQFVIMFRAIYQEGLFRPAGTMKDFLDSLMAYYGSLGGEIRFKTEVRTMETKDERVCGLELTSGERIACDDVVSTIGYPATLDLLAGCDPDKMAGLLRNEARTAFEGQISFVESIYFLPSKMRNRLTRDRTIIFYNLDEPAQYCRPKEAVHVESGVICFPDNFQGLPEAEHFQVRITHPANYDLWKAAGREEYRQMKEDFGQRSREIVGQIIGRFDQDIVYQDSFTPVTIERYSNKANGAVYGSPVKIKDGKTPFANLFIAGTDQGYLGIVGSMLSGITMVNHHILGKN